VSRVYDLSAEQPDLREALAVVAAHVGLQCLPSVVAVIDQRWDQFEQLALTSPSADDIALLHAAVLAAGDDFIACNPKPTPPRRASCCLRSVASAARAWPTEGRRSRTPAPR
jgi:hypothetical protein